MMNFGFNSNFTSPFGNGMMYGTNFVDILFKHLMEQGWQGLTLVTIFNLYLYLSLDKIKDLFKYVNDKIAVYGKKKLEYYLQITYQKCSNFLSKIFQKVKISYKIKKNANKAFIETPSYNRVDLSISYLNKTDLMAIGNMIMKQKNKIGLYNYQRESSDQYKNLESYVLPGNIELETIPYLNDNIYVKLEQNVDMKLNVEFDGTIQILKDVKVKVNEGVQYISWQSFASISKVLTAPSSIYPQFAFKDWMSSPDSFFNSRCCGLLFYIYFTKNYQAMRDLIAFAAGAQNFDFMGKKYHLESKSPDLCTSIYPSNVTNFIDKLTDYVEKDFLPCFAANTKITDWAEAHKSLFEPVVSVTPSVTLYFESEKLSKESLVDCSRKFMSNLINEYYHQSNEAQGKKISIYQLYIRYDIQLQKKDNPEYAVWKEKYGTDAMSKEKDENSEETSDKVVVEEKPLETAIKDKKKKIHGRGGPYDEREFEFGYRIPYHYTPKEPSKFIEEEIKIPMAETKHIKSDRKLLQYLYLQQDVKETLESYLSNFKNGKTNYQKFGIPYKGGIIMSGVPGCGKSSTIMAIATYLGKDVFYMDLSKIKTNEELKLCIDYVKINSQNGGVIIFEDIDCMTNIVFKRDYGENQVQVSDSITKTIDEVQDELKLSFLLNILDGTMAPENVIFIMTTNHPEALDPALIRPGRMDITIDIKKCNNYQLQCVFRDLFGREISPDVLKRFMEYEFITAEVILHLFHNIYNKKSDEQLLSKFLRPE